MRGTRKCEIIRTTAATSSRRFAEMIKGKKELTFSVRRLDATRIVRMRIRQ